MPAKKIKFADYALHPTPRKLYVDTNFACDLLAHELNANNAAALKYREIQSMSFYNIVVGGGVELICSPFTFNEVLHLYCFRYPGGMDDLTTGFLQSQSGVQMPKPSERFKFFLRNYPNQCDAEWKKISYRVGATEELFDKYKIKIVHPLPSPQLTNITKNVCEFAAILKDFYVSIECTDSFHLAAATYLGADGIVSHDTGFLSVDGFTIYCAA
jgi:hypothetical protein